MTGDWEALREYLNERRVEQIGLFVTGLDEKQRADLAKQLTTYVRSEMPEPRWSDDPGASSLPSVAVAAVGLLPSSAAAATLLCRATLRMHWRFLPVPRMTAVAGTRGVDWLPDLATRMAAKMPRDSDEQGWRGVADLIVATGAAVPEHEAFVNGWAGWLRDPVWTRGWPEVEGERITQMAGRLLDGPFLSVLLPRIFEINGLGLVLGTSEAAVAPSLVALTKAERIDRAQLLDGCLMRLRQPDRPGALRFFTGLHDLLEPTPDELADRVEDYGDLAASSPSPVSSFALRHLRTLLDQGRLDVDVLLGVAPAVLERPEKGHVRSMLTLLDKAARRHPDRTGEIVTLLAAGFASPVYDVAEKALGLVLGRVGKLGPEVLQRLGGQAVGLPTDLRRRALEGGLPGAGEPPAPPEPSPVPVAGYEPWPAPITGLAEFEAAVDGRLGLTGWMGREQVMAALVTVSIDHFDAVRDLQQRLWALANGVHGYGGKNGYWSIDWEPGQAGFLRDAQWPYDPLLLTHSERPHRVEKFVTARDALLHGERIPHVNTWSHYPHMVVVLRMAEIGLGLGGQLPDFEGPTPRLLMATPTDLSGRVSAEVLLERLRQAEREGWQPWPLDLEQALLRLPRRVSPDLNQAAAELTSPAGRRFADWLGAGAAPLPVLRVRGGLRAREGTYRAEERRPGGVRVVVAELESKPRSGLHGSLFHIDRNQHPGMETGYGSLPPFDVFPDHREVISAWALTSIGQVRDGDAATCLPSGGDTGEPAGHATALLIAYHLGADRAGGRAAGVDAVISLAAAGRLDGSVLGEHLGALIADGPIVGSRIYPELAEAAGAGAGEVVWQVIAAMLPYVLDGRPTGLPDLLTLAADLAGRFCDGQAIPGLAVLAGRKGSGKAVVQARRLEEAIRGRVPAGDLVGGVPK
ncbi:hypothetical protein GCM10022223_44660 [Kineosporia mesophila]|uniref:Secreted protein n=1 Tax=Kineosporia mesophila TaxID=566012 RepID=A0ABP7A0Y7_9ACTN|nr:DUF6493 family protein [Kineosporia mesophila]MCD5348888.1 DUF6493 family protein [Kineosporia mesophila]